ncbi:hypothetical protein SANA_29220 [Gottschalkiaceae bacterium SANA]|nr:hypothetical protein SANA_29220 [Gottschalkiaceae bacterium SANA]
MKGLLAKGVVIALIGIASFASAAGNKSARAPSFDIHVENARASFQEVEGIIEDVKPQAYLMADAASWKTVGDKSIFSRAVKGLVSEFETQTSGLVGQVEFDKSKSVSLHPKVEKQAAQMDRPGTILPWVVSARLRDTKEAVKMLTNVDKMKVQKPTLLLLSGQNQEGEDYRPAMLANKFSSLGDQVQVNSYGELQERSRRQMSLFGVGALLLLVASGIFKIRHRQISPAAWRFLAAAILATQIEYASLPLEVINENLVSLSWYLDQIRGLREHLFFAHQRMMSEEYLHQLTLLRLEGTGMFAAWLGLCWIERDLRRKKR